MSTLAPTRRFTGWRWVMLLMIFMVYLIAVADRSTMSFAAPLISERFHINNTQMGLLFSAFAWVYSLFSLPAGLMIDRIGAKWGILIGLVIWSAGTLVTGFAGLITNVFGFFLTARIIVGAAEAVVTPGSAKVIATWFPTRERGIATALWVSSIYVSMVVVSPAMASILQRHGWEPVFSGMGAIGLIFGSFWMVIYYHPLRHPKLTNVELTYIVDGGATISHEHSSTTNDDSGPKRSGFRIKAAEVGYLLRQPRLLAIFFCQFFYNSIAFFLQSWLPTYLVKEHGFSIVDVGSMMVAAGIGGAIAAAAGGFAVDRIYRRTGSVALSRKIPLTVGLILCTLILCVIYVHSYATMMALLVAVYVGKSIANSNWLLISDIAPRNLMGTTGGLLNAIGGLGGAVSGVLIGYLVDLTGSFDSGLVLIAGQTLLAIAIYWLVLRDMSRISMPGETVPTTASHKTRAGPLRF
jgi:ACS family glucarate transporter-like MFS transporter